MNLFAGGIVEVRVLRILDALEAMRVNRRIIPASKYGLETICGASCETGAQRASSWSRVDDGRDVVAAGRCVRLLDLFLS